jgi:inorganic pyrophosphatase
MPDSVLVTVEIPTGCRNKYEYDEELGLFRLDRMLFSSVVYPTEYGFVRDTLAEDGDPLDAMVLVAEPTFTGCVILARPVGLFKMVDEKGLDHKVLCVPVGDPLYVAVKDLDHVRPHLLKEIEHFFSIYKDLEEKEVTVGGWADAAAARKVIAAAVQAHADHVARGGRD